MPDDINNPLSNAGSDIPGNPGTSSIPGSTGASANPRESFESSKQHLREAAGSLRSNIETSRDHVRQAYDWSAIAEATE